ncbi:phosphotransferase enzyme family protein [Leifsonia shinshuensis]|uniref:Phosphotransferase n=1 Tax=Leifsonia shinshuensis TaxID=150026 RepID=A0A7G6YAR4_9MICO|nr:phosphotransferase [Leifsonia shinshuensis]QNE35579.1 phosphotransferase [Leifsonia shinshuensis]
MLDPVAVDPATDVARRALSEFGIPSEAGLRLVNRRENVVFRVTTATGDWALKVHRPGYHTDSEIESESAFLQTLAGAGVGVARPLGLGDGTHVAHVPDPLGRAVQVSLQEWLPAATPLGSSPETFTGRASPAAAGLRELGRTIALLHDCAERSGAPAGYDRRAWDAAGLCGPDALWGRAHDLPTLSAEQRATLARVEDVLARDLAGLDRTAASYGPIHADLTLENVLVSDGRVVVIDFDDCGEGWYLFDLATACFFLTGHPQGDELVAAVLDGYRSQRPLTRHDAGAWHPLLLARALSYLAWSVERPDEEATRFHLSHLLPHILRASTLYLATGRTGWPDLDVARLTSPNPTPGAAS